jgi:hypothetical protein
MVINFFLWGLLIATSIYGAQETEVKNTLFSYYSNTCKNEKIPYLGDGCCTTLTQKDQKVFTGSLEHPLIVLSSKYKTLIALKNRGASIQSLIDNACTFFGDNLQYINVRVYAHVLEHDKHKHENRTQEQEIDFIEKQLIQGLQLAAQPDNIKKYIFDDDHLYKKFPAAPLFMIIKQTDDGPRLFHICPITEQLFDTTFDSHPNVEEQMELLKEKLVQDRIYKNPYYKALGDKYGVVRESEEQYGAYSFVKV